MKLFDGHFCRSFIKATKPNRKMIENCPTITPLQNVGTPLKSKSTIIYATPSLFITALRYRQLYTFQNQFISRIRFSCLRDAPTSTSVTHFGSISCLRQLVLSTYGPWALESFQRLGSNVGAVHARHCAGDVVTLSPSLERIADHAVEKPHYDERQKQSHQRKSADYQPAYNRPGFHSSIIGLPEAKSGP